MEVATLDIDRRISIHALRKESDRLVDVGLQPIPISIHALRKESDVARSRSSAARSHFNPRSP